MPAEIKHRLFLGLRLPNLQRTLAGNLRDGLDRYDSAVSNERLHITLAITGDFDSLPAYAAERMAAIGQGIAAGPVPISLDRLAASRDSVALRPARRIPALSALHATLVHAMQRCGLVRRGWSWSPHVTLAYRKGEPFTREVPAIGWEAREIVLIHSLVGATVHEELGRWPLLTRQGELF